MRVLIAIFLAHALVLSANVSAEECAPTQSMSSGTHFKPITTERVDVGEGLRVGGKILSAGDCEPIAGAKIAHWQANAQGVYVDTLRAYLYSAENGSYAFSTEWPAAFVPHIHFIVTAEGFRPLTTQWVGSELVDQIDFTMVLERL